MPIGWVAAATVVSGALSAGASESAASDQEQAAENATALQSNIYNTTVARNAPFVTQGTNAVNSLSDLLGTSGNTGAAGYGSLNAPFTPADYLANQDPGYQFQLQTGENAVTNAAAPAGSALGGAALKGLNTFAQGTAATGYQNAFNRYQTQNSNVFSRLSALAGIGQASANNTATAGNSFGTSAGSNMIGAGNAAAAGTIGSTNAITGSLSNAASQYYLSSLLGNGGTSGVSYGGVAPSGVDFDGSLDAAA